MNTAFDFAYPWLLVLVPLAALPLLPRRGDTLAFSWVAWLPEDRVGQWLGFVVRGSAVLAMAAIVVGLAGPGRSQRQVLRTGSGAQILILMDRSASMDETMNSKGVESPAGESKNKVARASLTNFVAQRPNDAACVHDVRHELGAGDAVYLRLPCDRSRDCRYGGGSRHAGHAT